MNIQDVFLNSVRKDKIPVTVFLTNGYQFKGIISSFDSFVIILESDGKQHFVYKHAVSTIVPSNGVILGESQ